MWNKMGILNRRLKTHMEAEIGHAGRNDAQELTAIPLRAAQYG